MRPFAALLVLVFVAGCQADTGPAAPASPVAAAPTATPAPEAALTGRVWMRTDSTGRPGVMRVFLPDGTLVMDSCWETYRLAPWRLEADSTLVWDEDGMEITAEILAAGRDELHLRLRLVSETVEEHYEAARAPFVCPDMQR